MIQVSENLWRGPRPKDLQVLKDQGFDCLISLQSGIYELLGEDNREWQFPCDYGIDYYHIPLNDFLPPRKDKIELALQKIASHKKTYVHCKHGVDRTGFLCAVYRMKVFGWAFEGAKLELFKHGFHKFPYLWWLRNLKTYENKKKA